MGCFLATPVLGLLVGTLVWGPLAYLGAIGPTNVFFSATLLMMMFSWVLSWAVMIALAPIVVRVVGRFGAQYVIALSIGAVVGVAVALLASSWLSGTDALVSIAGAGAVVGAVMAGFYCGFLRWSYQLSQRRDAN